MRMPPVLRTLRRVACAATAVLLAPAVAFAIAGNGHLQIHHVNVGQGDGMLLISPNGQTALFDDGNYLNCTGIKTYLQGLGVTTVDYHFMSHYHSDHLGCIDDLAAIGITIGTAGYDRGFSYSSGTYTAYVNTLGAKRTTIAKDQVVTLDAASAHPVTIKCVDLNGAGVYSVSGSDENAKSAVYLVSYGDFQEVIGGDLTGSVANNNDVETTIGPETGDVEIYKVHHHGSAYSSNDNWLAAVTPEVGIIQCGNGNSYGHPTASALGRLHAHGVHTYWTETGAGATPDPSWDKVGGTIVVQADWQSGAAYTVAGSGFTDTYYNGGGTPPPPPIHTTEVAEGMTMLKGSITTGDYTRLAVNDAVRVSVGAGVESSAYVTDWYGYAFLDHPPLNLTVTYDGNFTVSRTQYLYLWNWATSVWDQINSGTVSTTDVTKTWSTSTPANYVSASREVRFRVRGSTRAAGSYTCRGDYMAFEYDYTSGTAPMFIASDVDRNVAAAVAAALEAPVSAIDGSVDAFTAALHDEHDGHVHAERLDAEAIAKQIPLSTLRRVEGAPLPIGPRLVWTVGENDHVDGFNVYREDAAGALVFVGNDASLESANGEATFRFVDRSGATGGRYWLAARSCAGTEAVLGPIVIESAPTATKLQLALLGNPVRIEARFELSLPEDADVTLQMFDVQGRQIATPYRGHASAGPLRASWNLRDASGSAVKPGLYFARVEALGRTLFARVSVLEN